MKGTQDPQLSELACSLYKAISCDGRQVGMRCAPKDNEGHLCAFQYQQAHMVQPSHRLPQAVNCRMNTKNKLTPDVTRCKVDLSGRHK